MSNTKGSVFFTRGWVMVFVVFITAIVTQGFALYSFSMLRVPMTDMLGADPTQVSLGFSVYVLVIGFVSLVVGDIIDKIKLRGALILSAVFFAGGFFILGTLDTLWMVYAAYVIMGIGSALGGMVVVTGVPSNWFVKRRGIAVGIVWCATLPGSFITTSIVAQITASGSWQTAAIILGAISFIVLFGASFVLKWRPQDVGLLPDGMTKAEAAEVAERAGAAKLVGLNRRQAIKTAPFWLLVVAYGLIGIGEQGPFQNFAPFMTSQGYDLAAVGAFMNLLAFSGCCGKIVSGIIIDKIGPRWVYAGINFLAAIGLLAIVFDGSNLAILYVAGFFFGAALSSSTVCFSSAVTKTLGPKHFGQLWGLVWLSKPLMDAVGVPLITNVSNSPVGWTGAFTLASACIVVSAVFACFAKKTKQLALLEEQAAKELSESDDVKGSVLSDEGKRG